MRVNGFRSWLLSFLGSDVITDYEIRLATEAARSNRLENEVTALRAKLAEHDDSYKRLFDWKCFTAGQPTVFGHKFDFPASERAPMEPLGDLNEIEAIRKQHESFMAENDIFLTREELTKE